jgi:hypothetical protein
MRIRNELKLCDENCELRKWFIDTYFLDHADDTSQIILAYYYRTKNNKDTNIYVLVKKFHKHCIYYDDFETYLKKN